MKTVTIDSTFSQGGASSSQKMGLLLRIKDWFQRLFAFVTTAKNWKSSPKLWIGALIGLRLLYQFLREYGLTLFKKDLSKDHVFLTGAGSGIGRLMAERLGAMGCKLSISDINLQGVEETRDICIKKGVPAANIHVMHLDVSKRESIRQSAASAKATFGPVTILINNAGIVSGKPTMELTDAMIDRTMKVNTISHMHTIQEFLPDMISGRRGHIVSIASMAGLVGLPTLQDYCASKFGAVAIDEALRLELKKAGHYKYVNTTCICPYFINTGMFDGAKSAFPMYILSPEETVTRIINAIRQEEAQVTIPWRGNIIHLVKLLPISVVDGLGSVLGLQSQMDDFKGRGAITSRIPGIEAHNTDR